jgi:predicted MFS family arabinose efflux permease
MATPSDTSSERRSRALSDPAHRVAVVALASVLALDAADRSALGALAPALKAEFNIGNTEIGLLASVFAIVGALATVPVGILTDRARRITIIVVSVLLWCAATGVAAAAWTFAVLFVARITLGVVTAAGGPPVTSIVGDLFPSDVRGRVLGWVKSGELIGAAAGLVVAGILLPLSWRAVFAALALLGLVVAWRISRVDEPRRGGEGADEHGEQALDAPSQLRELIEEEDVEPDPELVLQGDQSERPLPEALAYVLRVHTVVMIIGASVLAEFFFTALQVFGVLYLVERFDISATVASLLIFAVGLGGFVGVILGGRLGDRLIERGMLTGRLHVGAWSYLAVSLVFLPVFLADSLAVAVPLLVVAAALLTAPIAPLEAARLDVIHPQLRGRAESARILARVCAQASAPLVFGALSETLGGGGSTGLQLAFLVLLPGLAAGGVLLMFASRHYPREVAAVQESTVGSGGDGGSGG